MSISYPLPANAAHIWTVGETVFLGFPPTDGHERGHSVFFEINIASLRKIAARKIDEETGRALEAMSSADRKSLISVITILHLLHEREQASREKTLETIGTPSAPVQYDLQAIMEALRAGRVTKIGPKTKADTINSIEELGL